MKMQTFIYILILVFFLGGCGANIAADLPDLPVDIDYLLRSSTPSNSKRIDINLSGLTAGKVEIYTDSLCGIDKKIGESTGDGDISLTLKSTALDGVYDFYFIHIPLSGISTDCIPTNMAYELDTIVSTPSLALTGEALSNLRNPQLSATEVEAGASIELYSDDLCEQKIQSNLVPPEVASIEIRPPELIADGVYNYYLKQTDVLGNVSPCSSGVVYTLDTQVTIPTIVLLDPSSENFNKRRPAFEISGLEESSVVSIYSDDQCSTLLDSIVVMGNTGKVQFSSNIVANGDYTYYAKQVDVLGNISTCSEGLLYAFQAPVAVDISAGTDYTCAILSDGSAQCWGDNSLTQIVVPSISSTVTQISSGQYHSCALLSDNSVTCWGSNSNGRRNISTIDQFVQVSAGSVHTCAILEDGASIQCQGYNSNGRTEPPSLGSNTAIEISAGAYHTCAILSDGSAVCWGTDAFGEATVPSIDTNTFVQISAGGRHTCAILSDGSAKCWGVDTYSIAEVPDIGTNTFTQISSGDQNVCGVLSDGSAVCWGNVGNGRSTVPDVGTRTFVKISAGRLHTCAILSDQSSMCWGDNNSGQTNVPAF